VYYYRYNKKKG
jgi:hypothetical protein